MGEVPPALSRHYANMQKSQHLTEIVICRFASNVFFVFFLDLGYFFFVSSSQY